MLRKVSHGHHARPVSEWLAPEIAPVGLVSMCLCLCCGGSTEQRPYGFIRTSMPDDPHDVVSVDAEGYFRIGLTRFLRTGQIHEISAWMETSERAVLREPGFSDSFTHDSVLASQESKVWTQARARCTLNIRDTDQGKKLSNDCLIGHFGKTTKFGIRRIARKGQTVSIVDTDPPRVLFNGYESTETLRDIALVMLEVVRRRARPGRGQGQAQTQALEQAPEQAPALLTSSEIELEGDDRFFGTQRAWQVGGSWPIGAKAYAQHLNTPQLTFEPSRTQGRVSFGRVVLNQGIRCLEINIQARASTKQFKLSGRRSYRDGDRRLIDASVEYEQTGHYPVDTTLQPLWKKGMMLLRQRHWVFFGGHKVLEEQTIKIRKVTFIKRAQ